MTLACQRTNDMVRVVWVQKLSEDLRQEREGCHLR